MALYKYCIFYINELKKFQFYPNPNILQYPTDSDITVIIELYVAIADYVKTQVACDSMRGFVNFFILFLWWR